MGLRGATRRGPSPTGPVYARIRVEAAQGGHKRSWSPRRPPQACCLLLLRSYDVLLQKQVEKPVNVVRTVMLTQVAKEHSCRTAPMVAAARSSLKSAGRLPVAVVVSAADVVVVDAAALFFFVLALRLLRDR